MWNEVVVACFKVLSCHLSDGTEKTMKNLNSWHLHVQNTKQKR